MPEMTPQQKLARGLRNAAAWYDEHPDAPVSEVPVRLGAHLGLDRDDIRAKLDLIGPGEDKLGSSGGPDQLFYRNVRGDGFLIAFYASAARVCDVTTRTEVSEKVVSEFVLPQVAPNAD